MEAENVYQDVPIFDLGEEFCKLQDQNQRLLEHIKTLENDVSRMCSELVDMKKVQHNLATNISELFKTAKAEIQRKDRMIGDLRSQLDDLIFRRSNNSCMKRSRDFSPMPESKRVKHRDFSPKPKEAKENKSGKLKSRSRSRSVDRSRTYSRRHYSRRLRSRSPYDRNRDKRSRSKSKNLSSGKDRYNREKDDGNKKYHASDVKSDQKNLAGVVDEGTIDSKSRPKTKSKDGAVLERREDNSSGCSISNKDAVEDLSTKILDDLGQKKQETSSLKKDNSSKIQSKVDEESLEIPKHLAFIEVHDKKSVRGPKTKKCNLEKIATNNKLKSQYIPEKPDLESLKAINSCNVTSLKGIDSSVPKKETKNNINENLIAVDVEQNKFQVQGLSVENESNFKENKPINSSELEVEQNRFQFEDRSVENKSNFKENKPINSSEHSDDKILESASILENSPKKSCARRRRCVMKIQD